MSRPRLSVALCTYNGAAYLGEQLESIACQSRAPDELIVCDDASQDGTVAVVEAFAREVRWPVRLFVNDENVGTTRNFERAIARCAGDVIALADQDDVWRPTKLERLERGLAANLRVGAAFSDADVVDEGLQPLGYRLWEAVRFTAAERAHVDAGRAVDVLLRHNVVTGATLAFAAPHRDLILPIPAFAWHDEWSALLIAAVAPLIAIDEPLLAYRQHVANQIGARPRRERRMARTPASRRTFGRRIALYTLARERLSGLARRPAAEVFAHLDGAIAHLAARQAALGCASRWRRLPIVVGEVVRRRYARYSSGVRSLRTDLLRPVR
jgi:glycosyltransferase involved in cell wall biosynthesis